MTLQFSKTLLVSLCLVYELVQAFICTSVFIFMYWPILNCLNMICRPVYNFQCTDTGSCLRRRHKSFAEISVHSEQMQTTIQTTVGGLSPLTCTMYMDLLLQRRSGGWITHSIDLILQYYWMNSNSFVHQLSFMHFMGDKM